MRGRVMMILASVALAGSLLATDAQARGGGGGGGGHGGFGGGFGGGHVGGFSAGHAGGFNAGHMGGLGGGMAGVGAGMAGLGAGHVGGAPAGRMADAGHDRLDGGRHRFAGSGYYGDGLVCPYYPYAVYDQSYYCPF